jgi:two-component system alkaline phosphatase synthesis response regulator PhoP
MLPTVLVIENDRSLRELLRVHLTNAGYEVLLAADAVAAGPVLLRRAQEVALAIIDAQLPYLSGVELVATLIADSTLPAIPAILVTAPDALPAAAESLGVPCLVKPFAADTLLDLVRTMLEPASAVSSASLRPAEPMKRAGNAR